MPVTLDFQNKTEPKPAVTEQDFSRQTYGILLAFVTLTAAMIRFWHLGYRGFMIDEGFSWAVSQLSWPDFWVGLKTRTADMTLYYFLLHLWSKLGQSEFVLRSLSAVFGVATVPLVAELGKRLFSRRAGIYAACFFTVHIFGIKFAQEVRAYPLVMLLATASWVQLSRTVQQPTRKNWLWFSVLSILSVYAHFIAALNVAAQFISLLLLNPKKLPWKRTGESVGTILVGLSPAALYTLTHKGDLSWIKHTDKAILIEFVDSVSGRSGSMLQVWVVGLIFVAVIICAVLTCRRSGFGMKSWAASVPVIGVMFPFIALVAVAAVQPIFVPRYIAYVVPALVLGLGWLCSMLQPSRSAALAGGLIALFAWPLPAYYREQSWQDFRGGVAYLGLHQQIGDAIIIWEPLARPAVEYYGRRLPVFPQILFPKSQDRWVPEDQMGVPDPYTQPQEFAKHDRIWLFYDLDKPAEQYNIIPALYFKRVVERTHRMISERQFLNVRVEEYVRK